MDNFLLVMFITMLLGAGVGHVFQIIKCQRSERDFCRHIMMAVKKKE